jgi:hypothetical protein
MNGAAPDTLAGAAAEAGASALGAAPAFDGEVTAAENGEPNQRLSTENAGETPATPGPYFEIASLEIRTARARR